MAAQQNLEQDGPNGIPSKEYEQIHTEKEAMESQKVEDNIISEKPAGDEESFLNLDDRKPDRARAQTVIAKSLYDFNEPFHDEELTNNFFIP